MTTAKKKTYHCPRVRECVPIGQVTAALSLGTTTDGVVHTYVYSSTASG